MNIDILWTSGIMLCLSTLSMLYASDVYFPQFSNTVAEWLAVLMTAAIAVIITTITLTGAA